MRRLRLTATEHAQLEHTVNTTSDRRLRDRCQAVLMARRGRRRRAIAHELGVQRPTGRRGRTQYGAQGWSGLPIQWAPGRPGRLPEPFAPTLQEWVTGGPQGCGLDRANWTDAELAVSLSQATGIEGKRTALRDGCQRHGIRR